MGAHPHPDVNFVAGLFALDILAEPFTRQSPLSLIAGIFWAAFSVPFFFIAWWIAFGDGAKYEPNHGATSDAP